MKWLAIVLFVTTESQFVDWIEKDISNYSGEYLYFEFEGNEIVFVERITVSVKGELLQFSVETNAKSVSFSTQPLKKNSFRLRVNGRGQTGKFMKRFPPSNAKGEVENGIRIGGKFYAKVVSEQF